MPRYPYSGNIRGCEKDSECTEVRARHLSLSNSFISQVFMNTCDVCMHVKRLHSNNLVSGAAVGTVEWGRYMC